MLDARVFTKHNLRLLKNPIQMRDCGVYPEREKEIASLRSQ